MTGLASLLLRAALMGLLASSAARAEPPRPPSTDPMDWLIQHVCADAADRPIAADPYGGCPAGTHERRLTAADPLPYLRHDQPGRDGDHPAGYMRHDTYPVRDVHDGSTLAANDFDFDYRTPYGVFEPGDGDGGDIYRVVDGWVSGSGTRDGGGFSQTFFGAGCTPYNGWAFFPTAFLQGLVAGRSGEAVVPIRGSYWEQNGEPWPGACTPGQGFSTTTLTTWTFEPGHLFGGMNCAPAKTIDTIVSTHGFPSVPGAQPHFHLERFYFTDLYGMTRWEAWAPADGDPKPGGICNGPARMTERGVAFVRVDCRDFSATLLQDPPRPRFPWPYPERNLLDNFHFDHATLAPWRASGRGLAWEARVSATAADTRYSRLKVGVRYLALPCTAPCNDAALVQDIPVARLPRLARYDYGFSGIARDGTPVTVRVSLSQRDRDGRQLDSTAFTVHLPATLDGPENGHSIYRAATTKLAISPPIAIRPETETLRFSLEPQGSVAVMDAWVEPR